jgi:uncharacterized protein with PIN domain
VSGGSYDAAARRALEKALRTGSPLVCPACGAALASHPVEPPAAVAYVRHRTLVICPRCHRSGSLDAKRPATQ